MNFSEENEPNSFCNILSDIYFIYIELLIGIIGTLLNLFCIIIFFKLVRSINTNDNLLKYLFIKSIIDTFLSLLIITLNVIEKVYHEETSFVYQVFSMLFFSYIPLVCELVSMLLEVASILNRYGALKNSLRSYSAKIGFKTKISLMFAYSSAFYAYKLFDEKIISETIINKNQTQITYTIQKNNLGNVAIILGYIHSSVRDGLCVLLILALNVLSFVELRKIMKNKKNIQLNKKEKTLKAELRLTMMIIATTSATFFGHILMFIRYMRVTFLNSNACFIVFSEFTFWSCNAFNFILYFYFNLNFKKTFLAFLFIFNLGK